MTRSRHSAARDKGCCAGRRPQAPCEPGRLGVRSSPRRVGARLKVPFQAVDGCARPGPCGGVGFTQGLSLKRAFEFPMLMASLVADKLASWDDPVSKWVPEYTFMAQRLDAAGDTFRSLVHDSAMAAPGAAIREQARSAMIIKRLRRWIPPGGSAGRPSRNGWPGSPAAPLAPGE